MNRIDDLSPMIVLIARDLGQHVAQDQQQHEEREGQEDVGDPHQDVVDAGRRR